MSELFCVSVYSNGGIIAKDKCKIRQPKMESKYLFISGTLIKRKRELFMYPLSCTRLELVERDGHKDRIRKWTRDVGRCWTMHDHKLSSTLIWIV